MWPRPVANPADGELGGTRAEAVPTRVLGLGACRDALVGRAAEVGHD